MGFIEKISPKWAYKREAWRQANEIQKRNYDAGMYDRQNRNWFAHNESGEQTDKYFRGTVRAVRWGSGRHRQSKGGSPGH